jgi:hypothetical protein
MADNNNTEVWKPVPGYLGYEASNLGRVRSLDRSIRQAKLRNGAKQRSLKGTILCKRKGYILKGSKGPKHSPYRSVSLPGKTLRVHYVVLLTFVGPRPKGMCVCHNNGDKLDNRLENLRYDTVRSNILDRRTHETDNRGERHGSSKLTEIEVRQIRNGLYNYYRRYIDRMAKRYDVQESCVRLILNRQHWGWLV